MHKNVLNTSLFALCLCAAGAYGQLATVPADLEFLGPSLVDTPIVAAPLIAQPAGRLQLVVQLTNAPVAAAAGENAKTRGPKINPGQQRAYANQLGKALDSIAQQVRALGGTEIARTRIALTAVIVEADSSQIAAIAAIPGVASVRPVGEYQLDLSETVPYIGAAALQTLGVDGTGAKVAVIDSGIDYTHKNLGGSGKVADFNNNDPTIIEPGTFPTAKVVGGYDFVGEVWPNGDRAPDPDPLDKGSGAGHGTHVADIIGGKSLDGAHKGVAPGVSLYAVKACSSVSSSCNGVALLLGMDFALDPNGDGCIEDAVDVINLSLGSAYGQKEDDLSFACANAVRLGVVVVASAGNNGDKPFVLGSPSSAPEVISVAETYVPSAKMYAITSGSITVYGSWQTWSAPPAAVSGQLQYGNGSGGNLNGCAAFAAGSLAGKIVLVDRGTCAVSIKVANAAAAGALAVIVANNVAQAPGDLPPDFSYGGGTPSVAGYSITKADGDNLKTVVGNTVTIDPANAVKFVRNVVPTSSRGPSYSYAEAKPDIAAPGASVSAVYGTGTEQAAFGGTSGAAPMVSGSAALLVQAKPGRTPLEIKALLMNTAETEIGLNPLALPGYLAPISRIGGGEVRVNNAYASTTAAWDADAPSGTLSFGYRALTGSPATQNSPANQKTVVVRNYGTKTRTYQITSSFRYPDDAASGAVTLSMPSSITVLANSSRTFNVKLKFDVDKLPIWALNGGSRGGDGYRLQGVEFDGYINIADAKDNIHVAWHVLPHRSAEVTPQRSNLVLKNGQGSLMLNNSDGAVDGRVDVFSLLGTSGRIPKRYLPGPGDNYAVIDLNAVGARLVGIGGGNYGIQFAVNTFGTRAHPLYPAEFDVYIDTNRDGDSDYILYTAENGGFGVTGQMLVYVYDVGTGKATAYYYGDADLESGNVILTAPLSVMGMTPSTQFDFSVYAFDNYFTGNLTDAIEGMTYTAGVPRYVASNPAPVVPVGGSYKLSVNAVLGGEVASPSEQGLLLMYRDARQQHEADAIFVSP